MASYNPASASYIVDPGDYVIRVGDSSRNTHVAAKINLASAWKTEQLANEETRCRRRRRHELKSDPANFYTYPTDAPRSLPHLRSH